jgi:subtilase family serine protease
VAADAASETGLALVKVVDGQAEVTPSSGTSAAAPMWAGVMALTRQYARHRIGFVNDALYALAQGPRYATSLHDVVEGDNTFTSLTPPATVTGFSAAPGWDPVSGWGSPNASVLVPLLARQLSLRRTGSGPAG